MDFLIIGNGSIGQQRCRALLELKDRGENVDNIYVHEPTHRTCLDGTLPASETSFEDKAPDWVFIATPHDVVADWVKVAASWGSKIFIEKPLGRDSVEALQIVNSLQTPEQLYVGFNYRFFEGVKQLTSDVQTKRFGNIISINMTLGHGGKPEDIGSWKLNPVTGAPDSLLDPGIHFLDWLSYNFEDEGGVTPLYGKSWSGFWNTGVKEEVHLLLGADRTIINIQTSLVRWRNTFRIEVNGTDGYGILTGRGGNYGEQIYLRGKRWGWKNSNSQMESEEIVTISDCNKPFIRETMSLLSGGTDNCTAEQALNTMILYDRCRDILG